MPPRKPVPRLSALSVSTAGEWIRIQIESISRRSFEVRRDCMKDPGGVQALAASSDKGIPAADATSRQKANEVCDACVSSLRTAIFASVPWYCHGALMERLLAVLSDFWAAIKQQHRKAENSCSGGCNTKPSVAHSIATVERYARLAIHPDVRTLTLSALPRAMKSEILRHLSTMTGLEKLDFGVTGSNGIVCGHGSDKWHSLWMSMRSLSRLTQLVLPNECQNETLAVLGQNCRELVYLDVSGSTKVTDHGATWLLHCRKLKHCDLYQACVGVETYAQLLLGLNLATVGRCDKFGQVLEYIAAHHGRKPSLPVKVCHSRDMNHQQLRLLSAICPRLTHVSLYVDEDMGDLLTPLTDLKELEELKLLACNFYADKIDVLLRSSGHQLTQLHLEHIDELDMNALSCIARTCVHLRKIVFFSCDFVENFGPPSSVRPFAKPPFRNLEVLVCISESAPNVIEFLLVNADMLRRVQFGSTAWFNDATVENVISKGALRNVEEIRILRSYELTMRSVDMLMERCPKLRILSEMEGWEGISPTELKNLRARIKRENFDLDTFAQWSIITG